MRLFDDRNQTLSHIADSGATHDASARKPNALWRSLRTGYEVLVFYSGWLAFGVGSILMGTVMGLARPLLTRARGTRIGQRYISGWFNLYLTYLRLTGLVKIDLSALDAIADDEHLILAPNHPSMLDAVLVISRLPRVTCIMKAQLWDNIVLGGGSRFAGYVRNDSQAQMIRAAVSALEAGGQLLLFPEGTRSVEHPVNPFKGAVSLIAKKSGAQVQTIFIESNTSFLGKHWPTLKRPSFPLQYRVRLGKRFDPPQNTEESKVYSQELEDYFRQELSRR
jgi:1-acyl-sn-glycerol-3-phosphate acyltransferase